MTRDAAGRWADAPRLIKRVIYRPVAVVLEEDEPPRRPSNGSKAPEKIIPIDAIRPYDSEYLAEQAAAEAANPSATATPFENDALPTDASMLLDTTMAPSTLNGALSSTPLPDIDALLARTPALDPDLLALATQPLAAAMSRTQSLEDVKPDVEQSQVRARVSVPAGLAQCSKRRGSGQYTDDGAYD